LSSALNSFEGKGLTVEQKNGKVYVFHGKQITVWLRKLVCRFWRAKAVVEVGKVLGDNPDISVLIEGHTDDVMVSSANPVLITGIYHKRATSIVAILGENAKG
jgi:chemotaxis protein MotB